jgi:uncharacterized cofD-like protein
MHNIVVIGGGTGSFTTLSGLKKIPNVNLTAIVPATDSGGSTGRLRDEFGYLPIGDVRQCLAALAEDQEESLLLRQLFSYRFDKGEAGLKGHNLGNLLLTALTEMLGDEMSAIESVEKLMNIQGHVYPVSLKKSTLVAEYENGQVIEGEHHIDEPEYPHDGRTKIVNLRVEPVVKICPAARKAIKEADLILIGPGDLYTSLIANLVVDGMKEAIRSSKAKLVYVVNLVTKFGQTYGYSARDFVDEIARYAGRSPDVILMNDNHLPKDILKRYELEFAYPVEDNLGKGKNIIRGNLLAREEIVTPKGDILKRSLIRHDGNKIADEIKELLNR